MGSVAGEDVRNESVALGRVKRAEMVKAFLVSGEYRQRFAGSPTGNQQGVSPEGTDGVSSWTSGSFGELLRQGLSQAIGISIHPMS